MAPGIGPTTLLYGLAIIDVVGVTILGARVVDVITN